MRFLVYGCGVLLTLGAMVCLGSVIYFTMELHLLPAVASLVCLAANLMMLLCVYLAWRLREREPELQPLHGPWHEKQDPGLSEGAR
ncbi:hypothetical protein SAMN02745129_2369 [Ferrimonas marina]|uniref:Uncharacterized protein n=1 Tax=Ferrimonas marina TaxID=299255 RepID=A0A1M5U2L3_9GAMM|nr:hypothetical protein SAMN02745129_2369 [Ferrimonas marina]